MRTSRFGFWDLIEVQGCVFVLVGCLLRGSPSAAYGCCVFYRLCINTDVAVNINEFSGRNNLPATAQYVDVRTRLLCDPAAKDSNCKGFERADIRAQKLLVHIFFILSPSFCPADRIIFQRPQCLWGRWMKKSSHTTLRWFLACKGDENEKKNKIRCCKAPFLSEWPRLFNQAAQHQCVKLLKLLCFFSPVSLFAQLTRVKLPHLFIFLTTLLTMSFNCKHLSTRVPPPVPTSLVYYCLIFKTNRKAVVSITKSKQGTEMLHWKSGSTNTPPPAVIA